MSQDTSTATTDKTYADGLAKAAELCKHMAQKWSYARKVATLCADAIEKEMKNVPQPEAEPQQKET